MSTFNKNKVYIFLGFVGLFSILVALKMLVIQVSPSSEIWEYLEAVPGQDGQAIVVGRKTIEYLSECSVRICVYELENKKWKLQHYGDYAIKGSNLVNASGEIIAFINTDKGMLMVNEKGGDASEFYYRRQTGRTKSTDKKQEKKLTRGRRKAEGSYIKIQQMKYTPKIHLKKLAKGSMIQTL